MDSWGWDAPQVRYADQGLVGQEAQAAGRVSMVDIKENFKEFLRSFRIGSSYKYRDQIHRNNNLNLSVIEISVDDIRTHSEELARTLMEKPNEIIPLLEAAAAEVAASMAFSGREEVIAYQVVLSSSQNESNIRELTAFDIAKLVKIPGIIVSASRISVKASLLTFQCKFCQHAIASRVRPGFGGIQIPRTCGRARMPGEAPCPMDPYEVVPEKGIYHDHQVLKLQERPELVPSGEIPRHILLYSEGILANRTVPGDRVNVFGVFSVFESRKSASQNMGTGIRSPYIRVLGFDMIGDKRTTTEFSPEEEAEFTSMARKKSFQISFQRSIAPSIYGYPEIKKAIMCLLFGGSPVHLPDGTRLRGDINVLLLGDPSTAKSQMLKFVEKVAPIAIYTSGKGSSAAGLTASVVRESGSREFYLEGGAMVLADGGVVCIDEFDKMREEDRVAIHEAMEQQTISIAKAGITTILNSRTSVLAAANPHFGRYDDLKSAYENIDFQTTILSRFDLIFIVKDIHDPERDSRLADHIINMHMMASDDTSREEGEISIEKMKRYISYCKTKVNPRLSKEAAETLAQHYVHIRSQARKNMEDARKSGGRVGPGKNAYDTIPISVRQLEAIIRISESLARISLQSISASSQVQEAINLFKSSTLEAASSGNVARLENWNELTRMKVEKVESQIKKLLSIDQMVKEKNLIGTLRQQGFEDVSILQCLHILIQRGDLEQRRKFFVVRIR